MTTTSRELQQLAALGLAGVLISCGGAPGQGAHHTDQSPTPIGAPATEERPASAAMGPETEEWDAKPPAPEPALEPTPILAFEPATPALRAEVEVLALEDGASIGRVSFHQLGDEVVIVGDFADLPPGLRGIRVHEHADCGGKGARRSGGQFNPTGARHGPPESPQRHAGNFGNLQVGEDGRATFDLTTDSLTVTAGPTSVVDRSLVITARRDNFKSAKSAGPAIACGVIALDAQSKTAAASPY
jgi:superoxide dismutase, Cu-Zn family